MKRSHDVAIDEKIEFDSLLQNKQLLQGLKQSGYQQPSPVQLKAIPLGRLGMDLVAQAKSGTGKTVVFSVIALESLQVHIKLPQVIMVAPTREIAVQIRDVVRGLAECMPTVQCHSFIGGLPTPPETLSHCQVVVGTPGRLMALLESKKLATQHVKLVVLDEADKLMSDTFRPQIQYIFSKLKHQHQTIAFSATFTEALMDQLNTFLKDPQIIRLTEGVPTLNEVQQYYIKLNINKDASKLDVYKMKFEAVEKVLSQIGFYQCMIFVNSLRRSMELSQWLNEMGWKSGLIHAGLSQSKRLHVMEQARDFKIRVLVCSDLIARGIDIDRVNLVINLDLPWEVETYLHRVGRTGRYGTSGIAVNLIGPEDKSFLKQLLEQDITIEPLPDKVSYNEFLVQLNENDQETLQTYQSQPIKSKPVVLQHESKRKSKVTRHEMVPSKQKAPKQQHSTLSSTPKVSSIPETFSISETPSILPLPSPPVLPRLPRQHFIPPDLFF